MAKQIVFIDGIGGKRYMRGKLIRYFQGMGYSVHCFDYSPSSQPLAEIKAQLTAFLKEISGKGEYHAIGYSFGGVLLRLVLQESCATFKNPRRAVMLASPAKHMRLVSAFRHWRIYRAMTGECGQLVANANAMQAIPFPALPTACIYGVWPWLGMLGLLIGFIPSHDGMVTADEAGPEKFQRAVPVNASHAFIPSNQQALAAAYDWLCGAPN